MTPKIIQGVRPNPDGLCLDGFHVYVFDGYWRWTGCYATLTRALHHAKLCGDASPRRSP